MNFVKGLLALAVLAAPATSLAITFDFSSSSFSEYEWERQYSSEGLNLTVSGYTSTNYWGNEIYQTAVGAFSSNGLGAEWAWTPDHAVDNDAKKYDMLLFTFDDAVSLDSTSIGWWQNDSDMTILAYTGAGDAADSFNGKSWAEAITADSWNGGHFTDVASTGTVASNPLGLTSTSWLVGTFLEPVDTQYQRYGANVSYGSDYVKVKSVSVSKPAHTVPEINGAQSGLALALLASLVAFTRERRRVLGK